MDPEEILANAQAAIAAGADVEAVITRTTTIGNDAGLGGDLGFALRSRLEGEELARQAELFGRVAERGVAANVAGQALQGVSMGFFPEIVGMFGGDREALEQAIAENREAVPVGSFAAEIGGGLLLPSLAAGRAAQGGVVGRGLLAAGGIGAAAGGVAGFGEAEGDLIERLRTGAVPGAIFGGVVGGTLGAGGAFLSPRVRAAFTGRAGRNVAEAAEQLSPPGVTRHINTIRATQDDAIAIARGKLNDLDDRHTEIVSDRLEDFLDNIRGTDAGAALGQASPEVAAGQRFASLKDMRALLSNLKRGKFFEQRDKLRGILEREVPDFRARNNEFFRENSILEALEIGQRGSGKKFGNASTLSRSQIQTNTGANVTRALQNLPAESHDAFLSGILQRNMQKLLRDEKGVSVQVLRTVIDDVGVEGKLREIFPTDRVADEFVSLIREEVGAEVLKTFLRRAGITIAAVAGVGGVVSLATGGP